MRITTGERERERRASEFIKELPGSRVASSRYTKESGGSEKTRRRKVITCAADAADDVMVASERAAAAAAAASESIAKLII